MRRRATERTQSGIRHIDTVDLTAAERNAAIAECRRVNAERSREDATWRAAPCVDANGHLCIRCENIGRSVAAGTPDRPESPPGNGHPLGAASSA